ncbi:MAG: glycerol-3-phosphate 1-O-acyltransferase PlsY [Thermodesulfovibrionales bacterium]|nr:glycerol-3-phosphate 1-O-acyltransferase PlsY [Thermodesulfovibrionales bacterium]
MINIDTSTIFLIILASFLIGSIPTGLIIAKTKGIDIRKVGSKNIGATNVLRTVGKKEALFTLIGDISKGIIPVVVTKLLFSDISTQVFEINLFDKTYLLKGLSTLQGIAGLSAVLGHNFSVFLGFRGGKGVATGIGMILGYVPHAGLLTITAWLFTLRWSGISSLSALVSFALTPVFVFFIDKSPEKILFASILAVLIFISHRSNIKRLIEGKEDKVSFMKRR